MTNEMDQAQLTGSPYSLWWDGYEYKFGELTDAVQGEFTAWLKCRAMASPYESADAFKKPDGSMDNQRLADAISQINDNITSLQYDWGGPLSAQALATLSGQSKLLHILHSRSGQEEKATIQEIVLLLMAKQQQNNAAGIDPQHGEIANFLRTLMEDAAPKSRAAALAKMKRNNAA